ncbi:hypothetical protein [Aquimarina sp. 2201CG14-23]|uniref:hypothetical protein n=1 Tax=Aquimarina mycalae TaxID=3040073 RepID=UPI002477CDF3|nr:hypothetical protein [Aquimarina sp. 2201CG14-23]MDH7444964.1 hypothetical protein [Aquimarina sp. 2201CG14-23]
MSDNKDFWSKLEVISKIIGAILIPLTIFLVGQKFNQEKELANKNQRDFQNTIELLKLCNNENDELRLAGFDYAVYLQGKNLLDDGLIPILSRVQADEKDSETAIKTGEIFETIKSNSKSNAQLKDLDTDLFSRVYFHINQKNQRNRAKELKSFLESKEGEFENGISVPGIELKEYSFQESQLRVFKKEELKLARKIVNVVRDFGASIQVVDLSKRYPNANIRPRHFEIWLGDEFK